MKESPELNPEELHMQFLSTQMRDYLQIQSCLCLLSKIQISLVLYHKDLLSFPVCGPVSWGSLFQMQHW